MLAHDILKMNAVVAVLDANPAGRLSTSAVSARTLHCSTAPSEENIVSYDFMLLKGSPDSDFEMLVEGAMSEPIGTVDDVRKQISEVFPSLE
jgi:hypothetical protein